MSTIAVRNANQMMISADIRDDGIFVSYADGKSGVVPFGEIEGIDGRDSIERLGVAESLRGRAGHDRRIARGIALGFCPVALR